MKHPELHHILVENTPKHCKIKTIYCPYETGKYPAYEAFSSCDECNHEDIAALAAAAEDGEDEIEAHGVKHIRLPWEWEWLSPAGECYICANDHEVDAILPDGRYAVNFREEDGFINADESDCIPIGEI